MKTKFKLILVLSFNLSTLFGQKSVSYVIAQGYLAGECENLIQSATIGQAMAGTFQCGDYTILVGFQQPMELITTPNKDIQLIHQLQLYPNPASSHLNLEGKVNKSATHLKLIISDMLGRQTKIIPFDPYLTKHRISIEDLKPGLYILTLTDSQYRRQSILFIKQSDSN
jgi:hypothetical protein